MTISAVILFVIGLCFVLGAIDFIIGDKMRLGTIFADTFRKMGAVALGIMGLYSLAPVFSQGLGAVFIPLAAVLHMEPAAFPALLFPVDLGGWGLCTGIAQDAQLGAFFGAVAASILGATVGYCIPVSSTLIHKDLHPDLALGTLSGLVVIPIALFVGGLTAGFNALQLLWNLLPALVLAVLLCIGLIVRPTLMTTIFTWFGRIMSGIGLSGIALQVLRVFGIWTPLPGLAPLDEASLMVVRVAFTMAGAMVLIELLQRLFKKPMEALGKKLGADGNTVAGLMIATVSALIVYSSFDKYPSRGRVLLAAFCASGAFLLGGQFSVVSLWAPEMVLAFIVAKLSGGLLAILLALWLKTRREREAAQGA